MTITQLPSPLYQGNSVTAGVTFRNPVPGLPQSQWPPVDPTTVTLTVIDGAGTETVYVYGVGSVITRLSTGAYSAEIDTSPAAGNYRVKWVGTDACAAVWASGFPVAPQPF